MQNDQQLLQYFKQEIALSAQRECLVIDQETKAIREKALARINQEAKMDASAKMERELNQITLENQKEISRMQRQTTLELIAKRQELQNQVFEAARQKLISFTAEKEYITFLKQKIAALPAEIYDGELEIGIANKDAQIFQELSDQFIKPVKIVVKDAMTIGGLIATNRTLGLVVDNSLDHQLEEQKEWFYHHSGLIIQ